MDSYNLYRLGNEFQGNKMINTILSKAIVKCCKLRDLPEDACNQETFYTQVDINECIMLTGTNRFPESMKFLM